MDAVSPQFAATAALEAYRARLTAVLAFLNDAATGKLALSTDAGDLSGILDTLVGYLLGAEEDFTASKGMLDKHTELVDQVARAKVELTEVTATSAVLADELCDLADVADLRLSELAAPIFASADAATATPVSLDTLVRAAERYAYTVRPPLMQPMPTAGQVRSSEMMKMQVEAAMAATEGRVPSLGLAPSKGGGEGWIDLHTWFAMPAQDTTMLDSAQSGTSAEATLESHLPIGPANSENIAVPGASTVDMSVFGVAASTTKSRAPGTGVDASAGASGDVDAMNMVVEPLPAPTPQSNVIPQYNAIDHVIGANGLDLFAESAEGASVSLTAAVVSEAGVSVASTSLLASTTTVIASSSVVPAPSVVGTSGASDGGVDAARAVPAAGLSMAALPPALRAALAAYMPAGWKPGDPLPANLPSLAALMRGASAQPSR